MQTIKKLWARLARYFDEERERRRILAEAPSQKQLRAMMNAVQQGRAELAEAAVRNGLRSL